MEELKRCVQLLSHGVEDWNNAASALLIVRFYFELEAISRFEDRNYACQGIVQCRNNYVEVLKSFNTLHTNHSNFSLMRNILDR